MKVTSNLLLLLLSLHLLLVKSISLTIQEEKNLRRQLETREITTNLVKLNSKEFRTAFQDATRTKTQLSWSNVVVIIPTYNERITNELVQAHFHTWMKHTKGLDVIIVTDDSDKREFQEIVPMSLSKHLNVEIYRSNAIKEGKKLRSKIVDAFDFVYNLYEDIDEKQIFLKMDTDSYIVPENVLELMNRIYQQTYPLPIDFGKGFCVHEEFCNSAGGIYGMSKAGVKAMLTYIKETPSIYTQEIKSELNNDNLLKHEDFFTSYAFAKGTNQQRPIINIQGFCEGLRRFKQPYKKLRKFYSIHMVKKPLDYILLHYLFYDDDGNLNPIELNADGIIPWQYIVKEEDVYDDDDDDDENSEDEED